MQIYPIEIIFVQHSVYISIALYNISPGLARLLAVPHYNNSSVALNASQYMGRYLIVSYLKSPI